MGGCIRRHVRKRTGSGSSTSWDDSGSAKVSARYDDVMTRALIGDRPPRTKTEGNPNSLRWAIDHGMWYCVLLSNPLHPRVDRDIMINTTGSMGRGGVVFAPPIANRSCGVVGWPASQTDSQVQLFYPIALQLTLCSRHHAKVVCS